MSLASTHASHCPYLLPDDFITLGPGLHYADSAIFDEVIGVKHDIHAAASTVMRALAEGVEYGSLCACMQPVTTTQLQDLLGFLNLIGGLKVHRGYKQSLRAAKAIVQQWFYGIIYAPFAKRYAGTILGATQAVVVACRGLLGISTVVGILVWFGQPGNSGTIALISLEASLLFVASIIGHEWAHTRCIRKTGQASILLRRGMQIHVLHQKLGRLQELITSLVGPLAGTSVAGIGGIIAAHTHYALLAFASFAIAILQTASLLPWYADGKSVAHALLPKQEHRP